VKRTSALVADTRDGKSADDEMRCGDTRHLASVASRVVQTDDIRQNGFSRFQDGGVRRWATNTIIRRT
jgi:hypothetical protein